MPERACADGIMFALAAPPGRQTSLTLSASISITKQRYALNMLIELDQPERRNRSRQRIASACEVHVCTTGETCDAILRALDLGGARVKLNSRSLVLTGRIQLRTKTEDHGMFQVVWQRGQELGLQALVL